MSYIRFSALVFLSLLVTVTPFLAVPVIGDSAVKADPNCCSQGCNCCEQAGSESGMQPERPGHDCNCQLSSSIPHSEKSLDAEIVRLNQYDIGHSEILKEQAADNDPIRSYKYSNIKSSGRLRSSIYIINCAFLI